MPSKNRVPFYLAAIIACRETESSDMEYVVIPLNEGDLSRNNAFGWLKAEYFRKENPLFKFNGPNALSRAKQYANAIVFQRRVDIGKEVIRAELKPLVIELDIAENRIYPLKYVSGKR